MKKREPRYTVDMNVNWWTVWRFLIRLKVELSYDPVIPLLGIYLKKTKKLIRKDTCTPYIHTSILYNGQEMEAI